MQTKKEVKIKKLKRQLSKQTKIAGSYRADLLKRAQEETKRIEAEIAEQEKEHAEFKKKRVEYREKHANLYNLSIDQLIKDFVIEMDAKNRAYLFITESGMFPQFRDYCLNN